MRFPLHDFYADAQGSLPTPHLFVRSDISGFSSSSASASLLRFSFFLLLRFSSRLASSTSSLFRFLQW